MQKLRRLIGLPVLEIEQGTQIGEVQEVVLNIGQAAVTGLVIVDPTWFSHERGIFFADLYSIGRDAVTVKSVAAVKDFSAVMADSGVDRLSALCDKEIYTETGDYLGVMTDVSWEPATGEIRFYELSDGFITDFLSGRLIMPLPPAQVAGRDKLIVPEAMIDLLQTANYDPGGVC